MNRRLIVSIIAIILAIMMILSVVLAALPANVFGTAAAADVFGEICTVLPFAAIAA